MKWLNALALLRLFSSANSVVSGAGLFCLLDTGLGGYAIASSCGVGKNHSDGTCPARAVEVQQ